MRRLRLEWIFCGSLALITLLVFARVLSASFVLWDDDINIYRNPHFGGLTREHLRWIFTDIAYTRVYAPLAWLTWAVIYQLTGLKPLGYHAANLIFHVANAVLLFWVLRAFFLPANPLPQDRTRIALSSFIGALFWAIHPLAVEPVAWATTLGYCQGGFFLFLSLLLFLQAPRLVSISYALAILAFAASLLTYPIALGAPLWFFLLQWCRRKRSQAWLSITDWKEIAVVTLPFACLSLFVFGLTLYARHHAAATWEPPPSLAQFGIFPRLMQACYGWFYFLWRPWWPVNLSPFYGRLITFDPFEAVFLGSAMVIILISFWVIRKTRARPELAIAWWSYLGILLPVAGIFEHPHFTNDRYFYLAGVIWAAVLAKALFHFPKPDRFRAVLGLAGLILLVFALSSAAQIQIWQNGVTLFEDTIAKMEPKYRPQFHWRLGVAYLGQNNPAKALEHFDRLLAAQPNNPAVHQNEGTIYFNLGKYDEAQQHFNTALALSPNDDELHNSLGAVFLSRQKTLQASNEFSTALTLNPRNENARRNLILLQQFARTNSAAKPLP